MYFPILINWTSLFPILGLSGGIFYFYSNFKRHFCKQRVDNLIRRAASDLVLHYLPMSHKKDARLTCVNSGTELTINQIYFSWKLNYVPAFEIFLVN